MNIIVSLVIGGIVGWLAGKIMNSALTVTGNIGLGIIGGIFGSILLGVIGLRGTGIIGNTIVGVIGACALIAISRAMKK